MISQKENYASYPGDLEKDQVKYTVQKIENFASYPGDLEGDQVKYIVHKIKDNYKKETGKYLPLAESFTNSPEKTSLNILKRFNQLKKNKEQVKDEDEDKKQESEKVTDEDKKQESEQVTEDKKQESEQVTDEEEQKDDTKSNNIDLLSEQKDRLKSQLELIQDNINNSMSMIDKKDKEITEKKVRGLMQKREILDKLNVVETRNRMLQLSEEKNIYKTKVINTAIAVILGGLTLSALFYVRRQKK